MSHNRAGQPASTEDLIDVPSLVAAYYTWEVDPEDSRQRVSFGTSGHRGCSHNGSFNAPHVLATTQAIVDYRRHHSIEGPVYLGRDPHALSEPAMMSALEVLLANGIEARVDSHGRYTPTPAVSRAILAHNSELDGGPSGNAAGRADGIVVTPSHNPPRDGGFKYNPPTGGPADAGATSWITERANEYLAAKLEGVQRVTVTSVLDERVVRHDYLQQYVAALPRVVDLAAIKKAGVRIGADPMGGAAVDFYEAIGKEHGISIEIVNSEVDPTWRFMTLDSDGEIRMDCSSVDAMASLIAQRHSYDVATGNDADADRHGIVTPDGGLVNPNHYLAVAIHYLFTHRPQWSADAAVGKTVVSSSTIDRVVADLGRELVEVPVGFKWFVPGLLEQSIGFGGEESAGASFLQFDGSVWTTDKDGIIMNLLAAEILAVTGKSVTQYYAELAEKHGAPAYARMDSVVGAEEKALLKALDPKQVTAEEIAGEGIVEKLTQAPGNGASLGGLKVTTPNAWFAARPSGTEDKYKIYAESFLGEQHLTEVQSEAKRLVDQVLGA